MSGLHRKREDLKAKYKQEILDWLFHSGSTQRIDALVMELVDKLLECMSINEMQEFFPEILVRRM
jgi:hypothetical protein